MTQSEALLEESLVTRLTGLGYQRVAIRDADELLVNLKQQLEKHNGISLSNAEFDKVLNHLDKGNVFDRAKTLRDRFQLTRDDGTSAYIEFLNTEEWCRNEYQVTHQITNDGTYKNRYDVTLLINGLPLDLGVDAQAFEDYKSKYLDLYDKARAQGELGGRVSIINDVDFELELIQRDEINVGYILKLLANLKESEKPDGHEQASVVDQKRKAVMDLLGSEIQLRSKRELIERFINEYMPHIGTSKDVETKFDAYWAAEREKSLAALCKAEKLETSAIIEIIAEYHFTQRAPLRERIVAALKEPPRILQRKAIVDRVTKRLMELIKTFDSDL